jgi:hypothetical protein
MHETPRHTGTARRRTAAAAICTALVAVAGALLVAPANASPVVLIPCAATSPIGTVDGATGPVQCGSSSPAPTAGTTTPVALAPSEAPPTTAVSATRSAAVDPLAAIDLGRSTSTVYPVKDGYLDSVKFSVRALDAGGHLVPVEGTAVLSKGATVVEAWTLDQPVSVLTWDGTMAAAVRTGVYTLHVTEWSADGSTLTERSRIRVVSKHVERRAIMVRSNVSTTAMHATMPRKVMHAFAKGIVTVRLRTVARVTGPAKLVFSGSGATRALALRDGVHTTKALTVPKGFERVTLTHDWARGAAELRSATAIWTYSALVR